MVAGKLTPIALLLVKDGSRGDKLLFKYPYCHEKITHLHITEPNEFTDKTYTDEDPLQPSQNTWQDPDNDPFQSSDRPATYVKDGFLTGLSDKGLSSLLAVKADMCGHRFELQINDVRLIGHPMAIPSKNSFQMFHLAMVLSAGMEPVVVQGYYSLCRRLAVGLAYMDTNKRYLSGHLDAMLAIHEQVAAKVASKQSAADPYDEILSSCELAQRLADMFHELCNKGEFCINFDNWFNFSFVMPLKVYSRLPVGQYFNLSRVSSLGVVRYMSVLLLAHRNTFLSHHFPLVTPTVRRVMDVCSVSSTLGKIATDADVIYGHIEKIVSHFIHRGLMLVIYPVCNRNKYVMSTKALDIVASHGLCRIYRQRFPHTRLSLYDLLEEFRAPTRPTQLLESCSSPQQKYESQFMILWLLECGLVYQVHLYVFISIPLPPSLTAHCTTRSNTRSGTVIAESADTITPDGITVDLETVQDLSPYSNGHETILSSTDHVSLVSNICETNPAEASCAIDSKPDNASAPTEGHDSSTDDSPAHTLRPVRRGERVRRVGHIHYTAEQPSVCPVCGGLLLSHWCDTCQDFLENISAPVSDASRVSDANDISSHLGELSQGEKNTHSDMLSGILAAQSDNTEIINSGDGQRAHPTSVLRMKSSEDDECTTDRKKKKVSWSQDSTAVGLFRDIASDEACPAPTDSTSPIVIGEYGGARQRSHDSVSDTCSLGSFTAGHLQQMQAAIRGLPASSVSDSDASTVTDPVPYTRHKSSRASVTSDNSTKHPVNSSGNISDIRNKTRARRLNDVPAEYPISNRDAVHEVSHNTPVNQPKNSATTSSRNASVATSWSSAQRAARGSRLTRPEQRNKVGSGEEEAELVTLLEAAHLTTLERCAAITLYEHFTHTISLHDLKTFLHVCSYFRGRHHLEEIMYCSNMSRDALLSVMDKFSLMLCVVEGPANNYPVSVT